MAYSAIHAPPGVGARPVDDESDRLVAGGGDMIKLVVTHPSCPGGAAAVAVERLKKAELDARLEGEDVICVTDPQSDVAIETLKKSGFRSFPAV